MQFPGDFFTPPAERSDEWPDNPEVRSTVAWFKSLIDPEQWSRRRLSVAERLYQGATGQSEKLGPKGRLFDTSDQFAWHLFLAEAYIDHIWNYDPVFGARVIPVFAALGRRIEGLKSIPGVEEVAKRAAFKEKAQPNGPIFELLVASAYERLGALPAFVPEARGVRKTHDLDVTIDQHRVAVECKRMETSDYAEAERERMRVLWGPSTAGLANEKTSTICRVRFKVPVSAVPDDYLSRVTAAFLRVGGTPVQRNDQIAECDIRKLNLTRLNQLLKTDDLLANSSRTFELLTGSYNKSGRYLLGWRIELADNPRYIKGCDLAIVLDWESASDEAIDAKARDILRKVAEANEQLPQDRPGIIHVGFESVEGEEVERRRHERILQSISSFRANGSGLTYIYTHYLVPQSPPDQSWVFDETSQWAKIPNYFSLRMPPGFFLVLPKEAGSRPGPH